MMPMAADSVTVNVVYHAGSNRREGEISGCCGQGTGARTPVSAAQAAGPKQVHNLGRDLGYKVLRSGYRAWNAVKQEGGAIQMSVMEQTTRLSSCM